MAKVELKDLLQAGVHFGHQTSRWNPKMRKYIFAERSGVYLLDLKKTLRQLDRARDLVRETVDAGKSVLFVCTKPQLAEIVRTEAERCGSFHVTERWVGGLLTNFQTIKKNIRRLKELETGLEEDHFEHYTKKEQILLDRERQKLDRYLSGIKDMTSLPGLVYVVDAKREEIAVKEAARLEIPLVAIADTNADPDRLDVPIPGNDDAIRAVSLITRAIADEVAAAKQEKPEPEAMEKEGVYTYSSDVGEREETEADRGRRKRPRRRPKPEVIAKRRKQEEEQQAGDEDAGPEEEADAEDAPASGPEAEAGSEEAAEPASEAEAGSGEEAETEAGAPEEPRSEAEDADEGDAGPEDEEGSGEEIPVSAGAGGSPEEEDEEAS